MTTEQNGRAAHAAALRPQAGAALPEWVQLLPAGQFAGRDGRGPYVCGDVRAIIARSLAEAHATAGELPIDFNHALEANTPGGDARAAGWIDALEARGGDVWGRVRWTRCGAEAVQSGEYRFLSPVFFHEKDSGAVLFIARAGLTNNPNLVLKSLNARQAAHATSDAGVRTLDAGDLAVCAVMGLDAAVYAAHKPALAAAAHATEHASMRALGLDATDLAVCRALSLDPRVYVVGRQTSSGAA